ncbi:hypothetical protein BJV82DRAFT_672565 [Fennellomyces sp. T-0311]|nr:hypothetical protein BJV82DRAFT_672565 [Fennellomyces sp. T-0311]
MKLMILFMLALSMLATIAQGNFIEPKENQILYAGQRTTVEYDPSDYTSNDTVSIFFDEARAHLLAGGPATQGKFTFTIPETAVTPEGRKGSTLLAVFRRNLYLHNVEDVFVKVLPASMSNQTEPKA